jgi:hypothetical protein
MLVASIDVNDGSMELELTAWAFDCCSITTLAILLGQCLVFNNQDYLLQLVCRVVYY